MIVLHPMKKGEEQDTYDLIIRVFREHVAPVYSENGVAKFLSMLSPNRLNEMKNGKNSFVILAKNQSRLIGMLAVINKSHIALIFVDSNYQGKSIGKRLINEATKTCLKRYPELTAMTVSSSPNSKLFYEAAGFAIQENELDEDGMRFTPMRKPIRR